MPSLFSVTSDQLSSWMVMFLWPFVRILALISTAPIFGESRVPRHVKVGLAALLSVAIGPTLGVLPAVPVVSLPGIWIIAQQVLIGVAMGLSMRLVFTAVQATGEYVGLQMGLSFASFFDPTSGGQTMVLARLLNMLAMLLFLAFDMHLMVISTLVESFHILPIANAGLAANGWMFLVLSAGQIFSAGLLLSLPVVTILLTINLAMGILNRASPQLSIFAIGFPLTLLIGILMLSQLMPYLGPFLEQRFIAGLENMLQVVQGLRP